MALRFRSELHVPPSDWQFGYEHSLVSMGSCFADSMGRRLERYKFRLLRNPFGVIYNPVSMVKPMVAALREEDPFTDSLFEREGNWYSYGLHSDMRHSDRDFLTMMIKGGLSATGEALRRASAVMLTFGTALAFRHMDRDEVVANCHKMPANLFRREMLSLRQMEDEMEAFLKVLWGFNPMARVILTVSPVRHLRSGIVDNSASKARLRVLADSLSARHPRVLYFPAYELMLDDLRDYRFCKPDLMHPTEVAEDYIWSKFSEAYIQPEARELMQKLESALRDMDHRPSDPLSDTHQKFLRQLEAKIEHLNNYLDLSLELAEVRERIN